MSARRRTSFDLAPGQWLNLQNGLDSRLVVRGAWCVRCGAAFVMCVARFVAALGAGAEDDSLERDRDARVAGVGLLVRIGTAGLPTKAIE